MSEQQKTFVSPIGKLIFPTLLKPRDYKGDGNFRYSTKLQLEGADAAALAEQIDQFMDEVKEKFKVKRTDDPPYTEALDANGEPIPGVLVFRFAVKAEGRTKQGEVFSLRPSVVDANGDPVPANLNLGTGSLARIAFRPFLRQKPKPGVSLQPTAVQIVKYVEYSGQGFTFDKVEGGFSAASMAGADAFTGRSSAQPPVADGVDEEVPF
jgi:hypothetical protein